MSKRVQGTAVPCTTVANLTERSETAPRSGEGRSETVSRVSPVGCPPKVEAGEGVMSKGVYGTIVPCTTIANLTEQSEIVAECQPSGLFSEGENEAEAC